MKIFHLLMVIFLFEIFFDNSVLSKQIDQNCEWANSNNPCIRIEKPISNSSEFTYDSIKKKIISKKDIESLNAKDLIDVLETIPEISITRSGPAGQQTSIFFRGANSNHTLVMINGIPINDQSTTQGLHDFGVDFIQVIQQIEIYPGSSASQFGSNAIGGAINLIMTGDYKDKFNFNVDKDKNFDALLNKNFQRENEVLNFKFGSIYNDTISARAGTNEDSDKLKNFTSNVNYQKWIRNNLQIFNNTYLRQTIAEYDNSSSNQTGYEGDNKMLNTQFGIKDSNKNKDRSLKVYFTRYDREYDERGVIDNYYSNVLGTKYDYSNSYKNKFSIGYGLDYKYDWGEFNNRGSYSASTKGNSDNIAAYANAGSKFGEYNYSIFLRNDKHKQTGNNMSYKVDLNRNLFENIKIGINRNTGLRNPTLYELFGTDSYGYSGNRNLKPEKSVTNEFYSNINFNKNSFLSVSLFKSAISNNIEYVSNKYINDNDDVDLNQYGTDIAYNLKSQESNLKVFFTQINSQDETKRKQLRRPEHNYGFNFTKKMNSKILGLYDLNLNYKHYGKHLDTHSTTFNRIEMDSTDIVNIGLSKKVKHRKFYFKISNLLKETYLRPHGYKQPGRHFKFGFTISR